MKEKIQIFIKSKAPYRIVRLLGYGVIYSFLPSFLTLCLIYFLGYDIEMVDVLPEFLLLAFGIAINTCSIGKDKEKHVNEILKGIMEFFSILTGFSCLVFYFALFNDAFPLINNMLQLKQENRLGTLYKCTIGIIIVNILLSIVAESLDAIHNYTEQTGGECSEENS